MDLIPIERIYLTIYLIHGRKVMFDGDLAMLYGVETKVLFQSVKRNSERFPGDFMFELRRDEFINLRSQFVTSSLKHGGLRRFPFKIVFDAIRQLIKEGESSNDRQIGFKTVD